MKNVEIAVCQSTVNLNLSKDVSTKFTFKPLSSQLILPASALKSLLKTAAEISNQWRHWGEAERKGNSCCFTQCSSSYIPVSWEHPGWLFPYLVARGEGTFAAPDHECCSISSFHTEGFLLWVILVWLEKFPLLFFFLICRMIHFLRWHLRP